MAISENISWSEKDWSSSCRCCGGNLVSIRGRHPKDGSRKVCPTCLAEKMDEIRNISDPNYGIAFADTKS